MEALPVDMIDTRTDARPIDAGTVSALTASIAAVGLINPIRVRAVGSRWQVIAGAHRLQACRDLGLAEIEAVVADDDDLHAELAMIDENLCRAELSPSDRARQTARRKEIYEALHPEAEAGIAGANARWNATAKSAVASFAAETAKATGAAARTVRLDAERGEKVIEEAMALIRGTVLDTGVYLDKLKRLTPNDQIAAIERDLLAERRRIREAKSSKETKLAPEPISDFEAEEKQYAALVSAWNRSGAGARERFREYIDNAVFDRGAA